MATSNTDLIRAALADLARTMTGDGRLSGARHVLGDALVAATRPFWKRYDLVDGRWEKLHGRRPRPIRDWIEDFYSTAEHWLKWYAWRPPTRRWDYSGPRWPFSRH